jgi:hypothetical protein
MHGQIFSDRGTQKSIEKSMKFKVVPPKERLVSKPSDGVDPSEVFTNDSIKLCVE